MTRFYTKEQQIISCILNLGVTVYLADNFLRRGRTVWAVVIVIFNLAAMSINFYLWHQIKKGRISAEKVKQGRLTILAILLISLACFFVVSRTARITPENPTVSAAMEQIVPKSGETKCIRIQLQGNKTFAEMERSDFSFGGWEFAAEINDDAAEEFWAILAAAELTPHVNAFTFTGSGIKFRVLYRLDWEDPEMPMLYLGLTSDGRGWIFRGPVAPHFVPACRVQLAGGSEAVQALGRAYIDLSAAQSA